MNTQIQNTNENEVLFFDIEVARRSKELLVDSLEYELFQKKTRDRKTGEYLEHNELIKEYNTKASLTMNYGVIVAIGVGFIKDNSVYIKSLKGDESCIIKDFCQIAAKFKYLCGSNIIGYDLPMITNYGWRHFNMANLLPDRFITNGKKPWNMNNVIDLMDVYRGTHYANSSVEELCYHFNVHTPKTEMCGADVSDTYWEDGVDKIIEYVKGDVLSSVNIFRRMRGKDVFDSLVDRDIDEAILEEKEEKNILSKLISGENVTKKEVEAMLEKLKASDNKEAAAPLISLIERYRKS